MPWLPPAVIATVASTVILSLVYFYLYHREQEHYLLFWAMGWTFYAIRMVLMLIMVTGHPAKALLIGNQVFALLNGFFLLWGTYAFVGGTLSTKWIIACLIGTAWIFFAILSNLPFLWMAIPTFIFIGLVTIRAGVIFTRRSDIGGAISHVAGWALILWGVHKLNYPLLRPVEQFAPLGYLIAAVLAMVSALAIILVYFHKNKSDLAQSESRHRSILMTAMDGFWITGIQGRLLEVNDAYCQVSGYDRDELLKMSIADLEAEEGAQEVAAHMQQLLERGQDRFESRHRRKDGSVFDVEVSVQWLLEGKEDRCVVFLRDITKRKKVEQALRDQGAQLRAIYKNSRDAIGVSVQGIHIAGNPAYANLFGYKDMDEILGKPILDLIAPESREQIADRVRRREQGEHVSNFYETRGLRKDGSAFDMEVTASNYSLQGQLNTLVILRDITDRKTAEEERLRNQKDLKETQRIAKLGSWRLDVQTNDVQWTEELYGMYGFDPNLPPPPYSEHMKLFTPESWELLSTSLANTVETGAPYELELETVRPDGSKGWMWVRGEAISDESGKTVELWGAAQNITERKKAEEKLRQSKALLDTTGRMARVGGWELDAETMGVTWTEETYRIHEVPLGHKPALDEAINFWHPDDRDKLTRAIQLALEKGEPYDLELRFITAKGRHLWARTACRPEVVEGRTVRLRGTFQDITERKEAEKALKDSEERFRVLTEESPLGISLLNAKGGYLYVNPAFVEMFGYSLEDISTGLDWFDLAFPDPDYRQRVRDAWLEDLKTESKGISRPRTFTVRCKKGDSRTILFRPVTISKGRQFIIYEDISEKTQAEEQRQKLEDQLRQAQKMEALGTLAGGIAHDFNNILAAIMGYSELALDKAEAGEGAPSEVRHVLYSAERAKDLVTQILTFSRKVETELKPIDLNSAVYQTEQMLERTIPRMVKIEHHLVDGLWPINADPSQMTQVVMNLCTNANDAMPDGGKLTIRTENVSLDEAYSDQHAEVMPGDYVRLTVSDTGHGMNQETLEHIFDPFFTQKEVGKGTGLGLATVYGVVKNHNGHIICHTELGRGTAFTVYLPALSGAVDGAPGQEEAEEVEIESGTEMILLVDDDEMLRNLGQQILARQGYQVITAISGEEALEIYGRSGEDIDLVVLDISMPGMGGHKCLQEILRLDPKVKVIISSGYALSGQLKGTIEQGASGFVPKPFSRMEMIKTIRKVLGG